MISVLSALDPFTLQMVAAMTMLLTLGASFVLWQSSIETYTRYWATGFFLICVGLLISGLRGAIPPLIAIVLGNSLTAMGGATVVNGMRAFCRPDARKWPVLMIGGVTAVLFFLLTYVYPSLHTRIVLIASFFAVVCLHMAWLLWNQAPAGARILPRTLAIMLAFQCGYYMLNISTALVPQSATDYPDAPAAYNAVYLNAIFISIILLFGFTGLTNRRLQMKLQHVAHHDALTGALNRHALDEIARRALSGRSASSQDCSGQKQHTALSVVVFDLDHFKHLNDNFGHHVGDQALQLFVEVARNNLRDGDEVGRMGGEEFCLVLPRTDSDTASRVAERLRRAVEEIRLPGLADVHLTVSAGVATANANQSWADLMKAADMALYTAKREGRNRIVVASLDEVAEPANTSENSTSSVA